MLCRHFDDGDDNYSHRIQQFIGLSVTSATQHWNAKTTWPGTSNHTTQTDRTSVPCVWRRLNGRNNSLYTSSYIPERKGTCATNVVKVRETVFIMPRAFNFLWVLGQFKATHLAFYVPLLEWRSWMKILLTWWCFLRFLDLSI